VVTVITVVGEESVGWRMIEVGEMEEVNSEVVAV
jgi:hypothetical protein